MNTVRADGETQVFAIALLPDPDTVRRVTQLRGMLPASGIREDIPHLPFVRGIHTASYMTDQELLTDLDPLLLPMATGAYMGTVEALWNMRGRTYGQSSMVELSLPEGLVRNRYELMRVLKARGYKIEKLETADYDPNIPVSLGVPFAGSQDFGSVLPVGHRVEFVDYALFRVVTRNGRVAIRPVRPQA